MTAPTAGYRGGQKIEDIMKVKGRSIFLENKWTAWGCQEEKAHEPGQTLLLPFIGITPFLLPESEYWHSGISRQRSAKTILICLSCHTPGPFQLSNFTRP